MSGPYGLALALFVSSLVLTGVSYYAYQVGVPHEGQALMGISAFFCIGGIVAAIWGAIDRRGRA